LGVPRRARFAMVCGKSIWKRSRNWGWFSVKAEHLAALVHLDKDTIRCISMRVPMTDQRTLRALPTLSLGDSARHRR
jgi:hypothetical protein